MLAWEPQQNLSTLGPDLQRSFWSRSTFSEPSRGPCPGIAFRGLFAQGFSSPDWNPGVKTNREGGRQLHVVALGHLVIKGHPLVKILLVRKSMKQWTVVPGGAPAPCHWCRSPS